MKAIIRTTYGSPDVLEFREIDKPTPKDNQVRVKIRATSVNPVDWHVLRGTPFIVRIMGFGLFKPKHQILGADIAGTVEAVGKIVTKFKPGDEVFGSGLGGFAEYACYGENKLLLKPGGMTFEQAAAVPVAGLTALQGLRDHGHLQAGQRVLVNGASGGVGTFAVQIAKALGTHVTGVCSTRNLEMVRSLGADKVIDYTKEDFTQGAERYDLILDTAASRSILKPFRVLSPLGVYVMVGGASMGFLQVIVLRPLLSRKAGRKIASMLTEVKQTDMAFLKELIESGKMNSVIDRTYPLSQTPEAIRYMEEGHARGKVVIIVQQ